MDLLISVTIILALAATAAIFLGITRLLHPSKPFAETPIKNSEAPPGISPQADPGQAPVPASRLFLPTLLYLLLLLFLAILTPLAILFPTQKLSTLLPMFLFLIPPSLAYGYLWRFSHLTPQEKAPAPRVRRPRS